MGIAHHLLHYVTWREWAVVLALDRGGWVGGREGGGRGRELGERPSLMRTRSTSKACREAITVGAGGARKLCKWQTCYWGGGEGSRGWGGEEHAGRRRDPRGCERHCRWETVQESGRARFTGPENAAARLLCLLPHPHPQVEAIQRLEMETRAGAQLCPGSWSQNSQESLTSKCDCQGHLWPPSYSI